MKKWVIVIGVILVFGYCLEELFRRRIGGMAGSYPFAVSWKMNADEAKLLNVINDLEKNNKILQPPYSKQSVVKRDTGYDWNSYEMISYLQEKKENPLIPLPQHSAQNSHTDYWLYINFYFEDTKEIVHTWTRPDVMDSSKTTFALVGFSRFGEGNSYKLINRDFAYFKNKKQIKKFKKTILEPILTELEKTK